MMRSRSTSAFACLLLLLAPSSAFAADGESTPLKLPSGGSSAAQTHVSGGGSLIRTLIGLALVVGLIYGIAWVLRQAKKSKEQRSAGTGLAPLATLPLGPNRSLHLVRAGSEVVLVGAAESGVTPIRTYTEDEAKALGLLESDDDVDPDAPAGASLLDLLRARTVR